MSLTRSLALYAACSVTQQLLDQEAAIKTMHSSTAAAMAELNNKLDQQLKMTEHLEAAVQVSRATRTALLTCVLDGN